MNSGERPIESKNKLLTTIAWKLGDKVTYALEGSIFVGGSVIQWLRDSLKCITSSAEVEALAESVPDTDGVYFVRHSRTWRAILGSVCPWRHIGNQPRHHDRPHSTCRS